MTPFIAPTMGPQFPQQSYFAPNPYPRPQALFPNQYPQPVQRNVFQQIPNSGPSRTQQIFRAMPRSNMSTGFRIPPRQNSSLQNQSIQPQPMSGISHPVARTLPPTRPHWQGHGNSHANYKPREMHVNETYNPYESTFYFDDPSTCEQYFQYEYPTQDNNLSFYEPNFSDANQENDSNFPLATENHAPE